MNSPRTSPHAGDSTPIPSPVIASIETDRKQPSYSTSSLPWKKGPAQFMPLLARPANRFDHALHQEYVIRVAVVLCISCLVLVGPAWSGAPGPDESEPERIAAAEPETPREATARPEGFPVLDPAARLLSGSDASEYWTLYIELESGHRIAQQFLLSNAGPGDHNAVAVGHLFEPGRGPYRYANGRRRQRWTLSKDRLFFDIAASHLDLHRPTGELRITKDDIEIRLFFDLSASDLARRVPADMLPKKYHVEVLAVAAETKGTIRAPWMTEPLATRGRTWLVHSWTKRAEAELLDRRLEIFGYENGTSFYGIRLTRGSRFQRAWLLSHSTSSSSPTTNKVIEYSINIAANWVEEPAARSQAPKGAYPVPERLTFISKPLSGHITLMNEWLRFDPLAVLPQPFRWFVRRKAKPHQVWAEARIGVRLSPAPEAPSSLPDAGENESASNSKRETEDKTAERGMMGVASITFMNPSKGR